MKMNDKNEYYTPPHIIEKVKSVLGIIDLDPFSCEFANDNFVKAEDYFDKEKSAHEYYWGEPKTVFMNPPFSNREYRPAVYQFLEQYKRIGFEAIVLTNNNTDTIVTQNLMRKSNSVCFPKRINFIGVDGKEQKGNRYAQIITYLGSNQGLFYDVFRGMGVVLSNPYNY